MIPAKNKESAAERLAFILGVSWAPAKVGPFAAVYLNEGLTIDFDEWNGEFAKGHYCFRVTESEFQAILERLKSAGIPFRSLPHGEVDFKVNRSVRGSIVYWGEPDGHVWEMLTESYARSGG
jgi:catechol 2,3-dioxygenase-like lactoylglutathione lyase family enzyme